MSILNTGQSPIHGEHLIFWYLGKYCRYHLVMPKVSREGLPMQDSIGGDNNRTPVIFQVSYSLVFVGEYQIKVIGNVGKK